MLGYISKYTKFILFKNCFLDSRRQLGTDLTIPGGVTTVDAKGALVLPGGIDLWTNFEASPWFDDDVSATSNVKSVDNFYNGTRAALIGGTTTVGKFNFFEC